jgi:hypothetical protein
VANAGLAAIAGRFAEDDLASIVDHWAGPGAPVDVVRADETHSAQPGISGGGRCSAGLVSLLGNHAHTIDYRLKETTP